MSKKETAPAEDKLPAEVSEIDALALENLHLKADKAQLALGAAVDAFRAKFIEMGQRYSFGAADGVDYATRKIERR